MTKYNGNETPLAIAGHNSLCSKYMYMEGVILHCKGNIHVCSV